MLRALALAGSLLLAAPLSAAAAWTYAASEHFEIFTSAGAGQAREALERFERIRAFFATHLNLSPPPGRRVRLILFANEREFRPYSINDAVVAYYRPAPTLDYIVMQPFGRASHSVMVHEYVHLIVARSGARYPVWLNEGMAEFFATLPSMGDNVPVGRMSRARLRGLVRSRLLDLERLFSITHESPEYQNAEHGGVFYAQSMALTHMLLADDRYRQGADAFLDLMRRGRPSAEAIEAVWGRSLAEVKRDLDQYIRDDRFDTRVVRFEEPARGPRADTHAVPDFDAELILANLLAAAREDAPKARAAFDRLSAQRPDDIALLESRAAFELQSRQIGEARQLLARAVALGTTNAGSHRDLGILTAGEDPAAAEYLLEQAVALNPTDIRARVSLATLVGARSAAGALAVLEPIRRVSPADAFDVLRLRANAYLVVEELERAHATARDLVRVAIGRRQRAVAERVLTAVEARLAARAESALSAPTAREP